MEFKSYKEGALYCYLSIVSPSPLLAVTDSVGTENNSNRSGGSRDRLQNYLELAGKLSEEKNLWVMIRETPESAKHFSQMQPQRIGWKYDVVANDTEGMGVDKGFVPAQAPYSPLHPDQSQGMLLFQLPDLHLLSDLSEDLLGDVNSHVTLLGLQSNGKDHLAALSSPEAPPQLQELLGEQDVFINITVGKEQGYYDTFLVKAGSDVTELLV